MADKQDNMKIEPDLPMAYELMHQGIQTLSNMEMNGIRIDLKHCKNEYKRLGDEIKELKKAIQETKEIKLWKKKYGKDFSLDSNKQIADIFFNEFGIEPRKLTDKGNPSTDKEALLDLEEAGFESITNILKMRKFEKLRNTYLKGIIQQTSPMGILHPEYAFHIARTYRTCVAKGTKILVCGRFKENPDGVPIEDVKVGEYVYCFDDDLNPTVKKVLWSGKTGHRKVVRVHYKGARGNYGHVDVTPDHKIRLIDGSYEEAQNLVGDFRKPEDSRHSPKIRVLAGRRIGDELLFSGHLKSGRGLHEHRFVYENFIGKIPDGFVVHHKNRDHLDHTPSNMELHTNSTHGKIHIKEVLQSEKWKQKNSESVKKRWAEGKIKAKAGEEHPLWKGFSKDDCLYFLFRGKGSITKAAKFAETDFGTFKGYVDFHEIDYGSIKLRFDKNGRFISRKRLERLSKHGRSKVSKILGHNYYKLIELYKFYGVDTKRKWGNQFGSFEPGNHIILKIEYLEEKTDVYDLEIEDHHNFIANEICVHNSSMNPNSQNFPKRDKESMRIVRSAFIPRKGHHLISNDFGGIEVKAAAWYHNDPVMFEYLFDDTKDMHADMAMQCYLMDSIDSSNPNEKDIRYCGKNKFVFPQFYGDYWRSCAHALWHAIDDMKLKLNDGTPLRKHLKSKGIKNLKQFENHLKEVENDFWNNRFRVYQQWKDQQVEFYIENGYIPVLTGFKCTALMDKKQCINYPIQAVAAHTLVKSLIMMEEELKKEGMNSLLVLQIHDDMIADVPEKEVEDYIELSKYVMIERMKKEWKFINTPLEVDPEITPKGKSWVDAVDYYKDFLKAA